MKLLNRYLRPSGDRIIIKKEKLNSQQFHPYEVRFFESGTAALAAAVIASCHSKPDISAPEIILPAYGCPDLISAVIYAGAKPVLIDLEPYMPWMSLENIKNCITENTVALIAVNFLGIAERIEKLRHICDEYSLTLIDDSAQAFPKTKSDKYWQGDYSIISFGRGKPVNMLAGGAVLTMKPDLINHLPAPEKETSSLINTLQYILKTTIYNLVITPKWYSLLEKLPWLDIGETRYKSLQSIQAMSQPALEMLAPNINAYRSKNNIICIYQKIIAELDHNKCQNIINLAQNDLVSPLLRFPFLIYNKKLRNIIYQELKSYGASIMYRSPLPAITGLENIITERISNYPDALNFSNSLLTLPTHEDVTHDDIQVIQSVLSNYIGRSSM